MSKTAFRAVCDESSRGRTARVTVMCPKCYKIIREIVVQVNGFNEWAYKFETRVERDEDGILRTVRGYFGSSYDGRGCCV